MIHIKRINLRHILMILFGLSFVGCLQEEELFLEVDSISPKEIGDGLELSTPISENVNASLLREAYDYIQEDEDLWPMRSLLVFRNGKLISEAYLKDLDDISQRRMIWSCTKQVTAMLVGIALDQGLIKSLDDPIEDYMGSALDGHDDKKNITIRNLITMRSGIAFSNDGAGGETDQLLRQKPASSLNFILDLPMTAQPGQLFNYNDGDPHLLSIIIQGLVGQPLDAWADDVLFSKIGVENLHWVRYKDGTTLGGFGIETTARELSKIALVIANKGEYNGQRIISSSWVEEMTTLKVETTYDNDMGYYWWVNTERNLHSMDGHGGQYAYVAPDYDLVITSTAIPNTQDDYQIRPDEFLRVVDRIIEACQ